MGKMEWSGGEWDNCNSIINKYILKNDASLPIWEENGCVSYSPNVAYLAHWGGEGAVAGFFFFIFPLKLRCILCSGAS